MGIRATLDADSRVESILQEPGGYFVNLARGWQWSGQRAFGCETLGEAARLLAAVRPDPETLADELRQADAGQGIESAYVYQAALLCEDCGKAQRAHLDSAFADNGADPGTDSDDSDRYPQGPYADGGGEADSPQHCDSCGAFLGNPLTGDGRAYVLARVAELRPAPGESFLEAADSDGFGLGLWLRHYGAELAQALDAGELAP